LGIIGSGARNTSSGNPNQYSDRGGNDGVLAMGWGSGTAEFPYLISPIQALTEKATEDGTTLVSSFNDTDLDAAAEAASGKTAALVFITADSGEAYITVEGNAGDRNDLNAWHSGDALVAKVAESNENTIVVVNSVGPIIMESWIENPNVKAVVWSGLPGQEAGNGLVDILYGVYNPSGRLPYTIAKAASDYSAQVIYTGTEPVQIPYPEGLNIDYRHFDASNIEPRYEFGYGLSYTTFEYSDITVSGAPEGGASFASTDAALFKKLVTVSFTVANTGTVDGHEVPQLYLTLPDSAESAPLNLKGFDYIPIKAGASSKVTLELSNHDFSIWDTGSQAWTVPSGSASISIGASSRDIKLTGGVTY
jgi:beta-glucosidase